VIAEPERPSLEDRRAAYAAWRSKLGQRAAENRAAVEEPRQPVAALSDEWSPEALFARSRTAD
jgi:hypothetical protein